RQACDEAAAHGIIRHSEYDRNERGGLHSRSDPAARGDDDIDLHADELGGDLGEALLLSLRPAILDDDVAALDPAELPRPLREGGGPQAPPRRRGGAEHAYGAPLRLLRARRKRPRRRAAEKRDELASLHHSITSSAVICMISGTVRPSALAVLRLITSSNLVGCTTGRAAGFAPLRMCPGEIPAWR